MFWNHNRLTLFIIGNEGRRPFITSSKSETLRSGQYGNHPEEIFSEKFFWSKLDYIHLNPVRAGIVAKASHYVYSSASNYVDDSGIIAITKVDNPVIDVLKSQSINTIYNW